MGKAIQSRMFFSDLCFSHFRLHLNLHEKTRFHDFFHESAGDTAVEIRSPCISLISDFNA